MIETKNVVNLYTDIMYTGLFSPCVFIGETGKMKCARKYSICKTTIECQVLLIFYSVVYWHISVSISKMNYVNILVYSHGMQNISFSQEIYLCH